MVTIGYRSHVVSLIILYCALAESNKAGYFVHVPIH